jgi:hypothetical protein
MALQSRLGASEQPSEYRVLGNVSEFPDDQIDAIESIWRNPDLQDGQAGTKRCNRVFGAEVRCGQPQDLNRPV